MLSKERLAELEAQAETRTELEDALLHTLGAHLSQAVYQIRITLAELDDIMFDTRLEADERVPQLTADIAPLVDQLEEVLSSALDRIPGMPTREEADQMAAEAIAARALTNPSTELH